MRQLAGVYVRVDDPMAARRLLEEAIEAGRRLGDTDPLAVMLAFDLAVVAEDLGNRHVARTNFARVAQSGPAALGDGHPAVVRARACLGPSAPPEPVRHMPPPLSPVGSFSPPPGPPLAPVARSVSRSRKSLVLAGVTVVAATAAVSAILARSPGTAGSAVQAAPGRVTLHDAGSSVMLAWERPANDSVSSFSITGGPVGEAPRQWGEATADAGSFQVAGLDPARDYCFAVVASYRADGAATSPQACTARAAAPPAPASAAAPSIAPAVSPSVPAVPSRTARTAAPATRPTKAPVTRTTTAAATRTAIVSPAAYSTVGWPFEARFTVSAADASAGGTVVSLSICVAGRCYLDGKVDVNDGVPAPYTVRLGSTEPEGAGAAWQLRLDRISRPDYDNLVAERNAAIAAGTWGATGTPASALNATPVSTLTVTKGR